MLKIVNIPTFQRELQVILDEINHSWVRKMLKKIKVIYFCGVYFIFHGNAIDSLYYWLLREIKFNRIFEAELFQITINKQNLWWSNAQQKNFNRSNWLTRDDCKSLDDKRVSFFKLSSILQSLKSILSPLLRFMRNVLKLAMILYAEN